MAQSEQCALTDAPAWTESTSQHIFTSSHYCKEIKTLKNLFWKTRVLLADLEYYLHKIYMDFIDFKLDIEYFLKNGIQKLSQ